MTKTKKCTKCLKYKKLVEFYKNKTTLSGLGSWCKMCVRYYANKYEKDNNDRVKLRQKKNYKNNKWKWVFSNIKRRYNIEKCHNYKSYGGSGIKHLITRNEIKELWFRDKAYEMKQPSIDRENPYGNYEFSNCRFIEMEENNKRPKRKKQ